MRDRIDILVNDTRPDGCLDVGLDCHTCILRTAADLATICDALDGHALRMAFLHIYQHPACTPMFSDFERAYLERTGRHTERSFAATAA